MSQRLSGARAQGAAAWNRRRGVVWNLVFVLLATTALLTTAATAKAAPTPRVKGLLSAVPNHITAKLRDPRRNVAASPDYIDQCATAGPNDKQCVKQSLQAINNARAAEGVRPMVLPRNYAKLSIVRQTYVVTNLERVDRGLRPIKGLTARLNTTAHNAAAAERDPTLLGAVMSLLGIREYASIWAGDFGPLASDYDWMYNDGYSSAGSINLDCQAPGSGGCWGHRHCILEKFAGLHTLLAGVGTTNAAGSSIAEIFVGSTHSSFSYVYTWARALAHGADGHQTAA